jgi:hypothetical protein
LLDHRPEDCGAVASPLSVHLSDPPVGKRPVVMSA